MSQSWQDVLKYGATRAIDRVAGDNEQGASEPAIVQVTGDESRREQEKYRAGTDGRSFLNSLQWHHYLLGGSVALLFIAGSVKLMKG